MSLINSILPSLSRETASRRNEATNDLGPTVRPIFEIKETDDAYGVVVHLPGVTKEGLDISDEDGVLTVTGRRSWKRPDAWTSLYRESSDATFLLTLRHDASVNVDKVVAELRDGILRVSLPKSEALKPRKIAVS